MDFELILLFKNHHKENEKSNQRNIFKHISDNTLVSSIYKNVLQLNKYIYKKKQIKVKRLKQTH